MSTLYISEYGGVGRDAQGLVAGAAAEPSIDQTVSVGGASVQSNAFAATTTFVRVVSDVTCSIVFGPNPTATTSKKRMGAEAIEYFMVPQGQAYKVAVIANT